MPITFWKPIDLKKFRDDLNGRIQLRAEEQGRAA